MSVVSREARREHRIVVRPHRAIVITHRVVAQLVTAERSYAPSAEHICTGQIRGNRFSLVLFEQTGCQAMPGIGGQHAAWLFVSIQSQRYGALRFKPETA